MSKGKSRSRFLQTLPMFNLRTLDIGGILSSKLPRWIENSYCLPNLEELTCNRVAGFGALPRLRSLNLRYMWNLECIGEELYYSAAGTGSGSSSSSSSTRTTIAFPSLKKLNLESMFSLKEWVVPVPTTQASTTNGATTNYCFPLLEEISIRDCLVLTTITPTTTIFPSLKVLYLDCTHVSATETLVTNNLNSLTSLKLVYIPNLVSLPRQGLMENNNTLLSLHIEGCDAFEGFCPPNKDEEVSQVVSSSSSCSSSSSSSSSARQSLRLYKCPALRFYPNIRSLTSLRALEIFGCKESKSLQDELTCLSSSSSFSSLEHLEYVRILKYNTATEETEEVFEWRK